MGLIVQPKQVSPLLHGKLFVFFTQIWDCSVDTELINRNNCAKNSFNRITIGTEVYWQFHTSFALERSSWQWTRSTENWVSAFCNPFSLWFVFVSRIPFLLWSRSEEWPLSWWKSSRTNWNEVSVQFTFLFIVWRSPWDVVEHRHGDDPSCELFWLIAHFWQELLEFVADLQRVESWEIFHSNSIGSPSIVSKALYCDELLNHVNLCFQTVFDCGFSLIFPKHNTESDNT